MKLIPEKLKKQRIYYMSGQTKKVNERIKQLHILKQAIKNYEPQIMEALKQDLNKSEFEGYLTELGATLSELDFCLKHLKRWSKAKKVKTAITHVGSKGYIVPEPYGVTLIIAPWNYPFQLAISPLVGAISAGNCAIIKPSELTPNTSAVIAKMIGEYFNEEFITVIEGGVDVSTALLNEKFDYIFYTGSTKVGKIVMEAAAKHLTPVTLELGGKSPCIIHKDAKLDLAAKRIVFGKFMNAGQTCVAPDYLYVHRSIKQQLIASLKKQIESMHGERIKAGEFTYVVNEQHFHRLVSYIDEAKVAYGGNNNKQKLLIEPTLLTDVNWEDAVMQDEIFGPILPIIEYEKIEDVTETINIKSKPLALYLFTESKSIERLILESVSFGGGCVNDTILHLGTPYLPFGGVGESGIGAYHGESSFETFSHYKSVLKQTTVFDLPIRYPHIKNSLKYIKKLYK